MHISDWPDQYSQSSPPGTGLSALLPTPSGLENINFKHVYEQTNMAATLNKMMFCLSGRFKSNHVKIYFYLNVFNRGRLKPKKLQEVAQSRLVCDIDSWWSNIRDFSRH